MHDLNGDMDKPLDDEIPKTNVSEREEAICHIHGAFYSGYIACPTCLAIADERPAQVATPQVGTAQDYADYLNALVTAFGEDMGDGAETALACEIERLKRLAEQAVAMRQVLGPESWYIDGEGIAKLLEARLKQPDQPPVSSQELCDYANTVERISAPLKRWADRYTEIAKGLRRTANYLERPHVK